MEGTMKRTDDWQRFADWVAASGPRYADELARWSEHAARHAHHLPGRFGLRAVEALQGIVDAVVDGVVDADTDADWGGGEWSDER
jgi:hypothetical protein